MAYNPNIPTSTDLLSTSQKNIQRNFKEISEQFVFDHYLNEDEDEDRGKHKKITFRRQSSDPVTVSDEQAIYTKDVGGNTELFIAPESAGTVYQATDQGVLKPALKVEASVTFDSKGNIMEAPNGTPLSFNIDSITWNGINDEWTIAFQTPISTADYYWVIGVVSRRGDRNTSISPVVVQPKNTGTYSNSVSTTQIVLKGYLNAPGIDISRTARTNVIIYT